MEPRAGAMVVWTQSWWLEVGPSLPGEIPGSWMNGGGRLHSPILAARAPTHSGGPHRHQRTRLPHIANTITPYYHHHTMLPLAHNTTICTPYYHHHIILHPSNP
jgi:hypothetical protein